MKNIKGKYKYPENFEEKYVNGSMGRETPSGEIIIDFYFEHFNKTNDFELEGSEFGIVGERNLDLEPTLEREVKCGIILNLKQAELIKNWLDKFVTSVKEKRTNQNNANDINKKDYGN